jgi:hypothetical protein
MTERDCYIKLYGRLDYEVVPHYRYKLERLVNEWTDCKEVAPGSVESKRNDVSGA